MLSGLITNLIKKDHGSLPKVSVNEASGVEGFDISIGKCRFTDQKYRSVIHSIIQDAQVKLKELVKGYCHHDLDNLIHVIGSENYDIAEPGYSFADTLLSGLETLLPKHKVCLETHFFEIGFFKTITDIGLKDWLKRSDEFMEILLLLIHISCGAPARGTELLNMTIINQVQHLLILTLEID